MSVKLKVLTVAYGGGHTRALIPVIRFLRSRGIDVQSLACTTGAIDMRKAGLPYLSYVDLIELLGVTDRKRARVLGERTFQWIDPSPLIPVCETKAYHGVNLLSLEKLLGSEQDALDLFLKKGRAAFDPCYAMRIVLAQLQPDVVVATNSPRTEKAAIDVAVEMGIRTVCLVDLLFDHNPHVKNPRFCDVWAVHNQQIRKKLSASVPADRIKITGNPAFGDLLPSGSARRSRLLSMQDRCEMTVLWISQPEPQPRSLLMVCRELMRIKKEVVDFKLLVKLHPTEEAEGHVYGNFSDEDFELVGGDESLHDCFSRTDIALCFNSTLGAQAYFLGIPCVQITGSAYDAVMPLAQLGLVEDVVQPYGDDLGSLAYWLRSKIEGGVKRLIETARASQGLDSVELLSRVITTP